MIIVFSSNVSWSIFNFRNDLLKSLKADGHTIHTVASRDDYSDKFDAEGFTFHEIRINNNSTNPVEDFNLVIQYYRVYKKIKPDVICHNAIKPNIYGTIAAKFLGIPVINNISGLGTLFIKNSLSTKIAKLLYRLSQRKADKVFFQNNDDLQIFIDYQLIKPEQTEIIPGSGVDTNTFIPLKNKTKDTFEFIFIGRLIYDKGILEYVEALRILKRKYKNIKGNVLGPIYHSNATAITQNDLDSWIEEGVISYLGVTNNVVEYMQKADCLVLPSYREGLSKVLIESSSVGLPIVTTDVPGCRDVVINNVTGLICKPKNVSDLSLKMEQILNMTKQQRDIMASEARQRAINVFNIEKVIDVYKKAIYMFDNSTLKSFKN